VRETRAARSARGIALLGLAVALTASGCARKGPPTGGPPDVLQPTVLAITPDSGATGVPLDARPTIEFSEGMEPRSANIAVEIAPHVDIRQRRWSGRRMTLVFAEPLAADRTYTLFVGSDARDRHGNPLAAGRAVPFSTAARFPPGVIEGEVAAVGFVAPGTYLWCYPEGRSPDSTARDFDAIGLAGDLGVFRITGLAVPGRYRVWAFADLNHNHSYEPDKDLLAPSDTSFALTEADPVVSGLKLRVVNPRAPARVRGTVLDSLGDERGPLRLIVRAEADTARRVLYEITSAGGLFDFKWEPGVYYVRAFRDLDRNKQWKREEEPASEELRVTLPPDADLELPAFVLARPETPSP
jgi:hypothetical protein